MKIIAIHQPHFLPWITYFHKIVKSDVFILLDDVQFRKNYYQNRALIKTEKGAAWLTISLKKAPLHTPINAIQMLPNQSFKGKIEASYRHAPYFYLWEEFLGNILCQNKNQLLATLNETLLKTVLNYLDIKTPLITASDFKLTISDPNHRLIELCKLNKATHYLSGVGGKSYINTDLFEQQGIQVLWQERNPSLQLPYPQQFGNFIPHLSIIDWLFNMSKESILERIGLL